MSLTAELPVAPVAPVSTAPAAPAPTPAAPATPEALTVETFLRDSANLTPDALFSLTPGPTPPEMLTRGRAASPKAPAAAPAPSAPTLVVPEPTPAPAPAATPAPVPAATPAPVEPVAAPAAQPTAADHVKNWRVVAKDAKEALVLKLVKDGTSLSEAYQEVYGSTAAPAPSAPPAPAGSISEPAPAPAPNPLTEADAVIAKIEADMSNLAKQIEEAATTGDTPAAIRLMRQEADLKISLNSARTNREATARQIEEHSVNRAVAEHRQLENASIAEAVKLYPALADKASEQRAEFNLKVAALQKDPAYGDKFRMNVPGWPLLVARMVAAEKGWGLTAPSAPAPVASAPAAAAPTPTPTPAPAPTTMTTQPPVNPLSPQTLPAPTTVPPVRAISAELISPSASPGGATPVVDAATFWKESASWHPNDALALMGHAPIPDFLKRRQSQDARRLGPA